MATDLGRAYVQIMPSAKGISGSISKTLNPEAISAGKSAGKNLTSSLSQSLSSLGSTFTKKITLPAMGAMTAVTGLVGALGFKRLIGMDNAQAKLKGMGYEGQRLESVMESAKNAVTGTTMTMAEGVDIASGALAAGIDQGADLEHYIKLVGSAAVGANRDVGEMAMIFNRVQGSGKLMTQELNMIEMGMPGFAQAMANHVADGSMEAFRDMVTNGQVGSEEFLHVMDDFAGGMADAYAGTWSGMAKNVISNIGIIGEALIGGLFKDGKKGMADFLEVLRSDGIQEWATRTGEKIREFVHVIVDGARTMIEWWNNLSPAIQEVASKIALFGTIGLISIGPLLNIIIPLVRAIGALIPIFTALFSPIGLVVGAIALLVAGFMLLWTTSEEFREFFMLLWEGLQEFITITVGAIVEFIQEIWGSLIEWWDENNELIMETVSTVWNAIETIISTILGIIVPIIETAFSSIQSIIESVWNVIKIVIDTTLNVILGIIKTIMQLITGDWSGAWESIKSTVSDLINGIKDTISGVMDTILTTISGVLDTIYSTFSSIFDSLFGVVTNAFGLVKGAVSDGMTAAYETVTGFVDKFFEAGKNIVTSIADGIKGAVDKVTGAVKNIAGKIRDFLPFSPPKTGPLMDIMDVKWGETIGGGILKGESVVADAMDSILDFDLSRVSSHNDYGDANSPLLDSLLRQNKLLEKILDKDTSVKVSKKDFVDVVNEENALSNVVKYF